MRYASIAFLAAGIWSLCEAVAVVDAVPETAQVPAAFVPNDANVTNVKDWGVVGDGKTDDTDALVRLFNHSTKRGYYYFPSGTYIISRPLFTSSRGCITDFQFITGAGVGATTLQLKSNLPWAQDPLNRSAVLTMGCSPAQNFHDGVFDLTINTGAGNPGAVGLRTNFNNNGAIRRVVLSTQDRNAAIGLDLSFSDQIGPMMVRDVTVGPGFAVGVAVAHGVDSITMEAITVQEPRAAGLFVTGQVTSVRGLSVTGSPSEAAVVVPRSTAFLTLLDSRFQCTKACSSTPALLLNGKATVDDMCNASSSATARPARPGRRSLYQLPTCELQSYGCWAVTNPNGIYQCTADCPSGNSLTVEKCLSCCGGKGYTFSSLGGGCACHCFNDWALARNITGARDVPMSNCSLPCDGDHNETCGGAMALQVLSPDLRPCFRNNTLDPSNVQSVFFGRNLSFDGFPLAVLNMTSAAPGPNASEPTVIGNVTHLDEWVTNPAVSIIPSVKANRSLGLPFPDTPEFNEPDPSKWANAAASCNSSRQHPGFNSKFWFDCSASFQAALDSGASTVYWPQAPNPANDTGLGSPAFWLMHDVHIPVTTRRVIGFYGYYGILIGNASIIIDEGDESDPPLIFERLAGELGGGTAPINFWHKSKRTVVFRDYSGLSTVDVWHHDLNRSIATGGYNNGTLPSWVPGAVFFDDVVGGPFRFNKQQVYARQLNTESSDLDIVNSGGELTVLGWKTEKGERSLMATVDGGKSEILGAFFYETGDTYGSVPGLFVDDTSQMTGSMQFINEYHRSTDVGLANMIVQALDGLNHTLLHNSSASGWIPRDGGQGAAALYVGTRDD